jgi:UPF0716 protein FxsA
MVGLLLLVGLPIVELLLLIQAGSVFGFWPTVGLVFLTAAIGIVLIRQQGAAALRSAQEDRARGEVPVHAILTGIRLAIAGILLIIPGFITDAFGLLLLIPGVSGGMLTAMEKSGSFRFAFRQDGFGAYGATGRYRDDSTIDAEFEVVSDGKTKSGPPAKKDEPDDDPKSLPKPGQGWGRRNG